MFGYITPDKPNMYIKDYTIYKAFYCGICKSTGKMYGQLMRLSTNYDITFFSILIHNILNKKVELSNEGCILNPLTRKSIVKMNGLMKKAVMLNVLLLDFKINDDIRDNNRLSKKILKILLKRKINKAKKALPEVSSRIELAREEQNRIENEKTSSLDKTAHPFAEMLKDVFKIMCEDKYTEDIGRLAYQIGRFIYFADAIDDLDKDIENNEFNPLVYAYPNVESKEKLLVSYKEDIHYLLNSAYEDVKISYQSMDFKLCEGVVTNILWYGMSATIARIFSGNDNDKRIKKRL